MKTPFLLLVLSLHCAALNAFGQGALDPPPGPPAPTMKRLDEVEPRTMVNAANTPGDATNTFIISAPGSYYLTSNITGETDKHGISIQANDVTLDLNGFAINSGGGTAVIGVNIPAEQENFCIRNGTVRGWTGGGVRAQTTRNVLAEKLRLSANAGSIGLAVGLGSIIKDCLALGNGIGFQTFDRAQISNCIATENTGHGIESGSYSTIIDCTASRNGGHGIRALGSCSIIRCNASRNLGLTTGVGHGDGINTGDGCTIADSTAGGNSIHGFRVGGGSTVRNCTAQSNGEKGIYSEGANCHIIGNTCDSNKRGIEASGRIDGNSCTSNTNVGIIAGGLVIRNSARNNNGNYSISGATGPIVDMTAGGSITSNSPWANFSY